MISVSDDFHSAESADVNKPATKVYLILGNYATSAFGSSASASGAATDYPASGAIDGDRTELNVGPASGADNDVGQSSWRSTVAPSTTPQTLTVDMGQSRTINRIKLYHLSSHGLSSYKIESSPDNSAWTLIDKTTDQGGSIATIQEVDTVDFSDVACRYVRITISGTSVGADMANIVEFEIYRLVDVTDRVISCKTTRDRDYQLSNSMAAISTIILSNTDKFFSPSHVPSSSEISDGFVNSELKPGLGLLVKYGYDFTGSQEYAQNFIGSIDKFIIKPGARTCTIEARDNMKVCFNKIISTKLKSGFDMGAIMTYVLNQANISTWETDVDNIGITIDYFFTFDELIIDTIRGIVEASGDGNFFFDENGIATFKSYLRSTAFDHTDSSEADFEAGTLTNIDTLTYPGKFTKKWFEIDTFGDGNYTSDPIWTEILGAYSPTGFSISSTGSNSLQYVAPGKIGSSTGWVGPGIGTIRSSDGNISTNASSITGTWRFRGKITDGLSSAGVLKLFFITTTTTTLAPSSDLIFGHNSFISAYYVAMVKGAGQIRIGKTDIGGNETDLVSAAQTFTSATYYDIRVTRSSAGVMNVYVDGVFKATATDTSISISNGMGFKLEDGTSAGTYSTYNMTDIYYSYTVESSNADYGLAPIFISQTVDQSVSVATEGIFHTTQIVPASTSIAWYTATSLDGFSWDADVAVVPGGSIASTPHRYIRYKAVFSSSVKLSAPTVTDVTVNWTIGTGSVKYPTSVSFVFDENLNMDLDQVYADTVAGDTAIINSVGVKAEPLVLSGADADVKWQGTTGVPPVQISVTDPLGITIAQVLTYPIVVDGGMDISRMSGANPPAAAITFAGGGAGTWIFSSIHPTRPILVITVTGTGTITNLQVQGKSFSNDNTLLEATSSDSASIKEFGKRETKITNPLIVNSATAQSIADRIISNLSEPTTYTPQIKVRPTFSIQVGDRITLQDTQLDINEDNLVIGVDHILSANMNGGESYSTLKLLKIVV